MQFSPDGFTVISFLNVRQTINNRLNLFNSFLFLFFLSIFSAPWLHETAEPCISLVVIYDTHTLRILQVHTWDDLVNSSALTLVPRRDKT